jgi:type III secretion protein Q
MSRVKQSPALSFNTTADLGSFPLVSPASLIAHNALYRRRQPLSADVLGKTVSIGLSALPWTANDTSHRFVVSAGIWNFQLELPGGLVEHLMNGLCKPASFKNLPSLQQAILIEAALESLLFPFEAALLQPIRFVADASLHAAEIQLDLHVILSSFEGVVRLGLNAEASALIASVWNQRASGEPFSVDQLPVPIQLLAGAQTLSLTEITALRPGDTILNDEGSPEVLYALCANQLQARCIQSEHGVTLIGDWQPATISQLEANDVLVERGTAMDEGAIDNLPVRVIFELARTDMSLREVKDLAEGSILPVSAVSQGAVAIVANGKRIGRGDIVRLGEGLGVRISQLNTND